MTNYSLGKIYKIVCNTTGLTYYGSTCEPTIARWLAGHVSGYKGWKKGQDISFMSSFEVLKNDNYSIVLVELAPSNNKMELLQRERFFIENNECVNKVVPTRTQQEYKEDNAEQISINNVEYYLVNKERIQAYYQGEEVKEKRRIYLRDYVERNKEANQNYHNTYYQNNKQKLLELQAEYRIKNRVIINERQNIAYSLKQKELKTAQQAAALNNELA